MNRVYAENVIEKIVSAERSAAEIMMHAHDIIAESKSGQRDIVTEYDKRVQEYLMQVLSESVPEARFFCEEQKEHDDLHARHLFIIDPIDGTMNFARGFNHSCISVAYMSAGELRAAAVYNPYVDEMFTAVKGEGAYLNGRRLHVSDAPLSDSVVCYGTSPYSTELADETFRLARIAFNAGLDLRREGSAELDLCSCILRCRCPSGTMRRARCLSVRRAAYARISAARSCRLTAQSRRYLQAAAMPSWIS